MCLMIVGFILMIVGISSNEAFNTLILPPVKDVASNPVVKRFLEFKNNIVVLQEHLWYQTTTTRRATVDSRVNIFKLLPRIFPEKSYRKNSQIFLRPYGYRYAFYPLNFNIVPISGKATSKNVSNKAPIKQGKSFNPKVHRDGKFRLNIPKGFKEKRQVPNGDVKFEIPSIKEIVSYGSSYPACYAVSHKFWPLLGRYQVSPARERRKRSHVSKRGDEHESQVEMKSWPLLSACSQILPLPRHSVEGRQIARGIQRRSPRSHNRRRNQMLIVSKLSEMKAKEHIAEDNRLAEMHKTQGAKRDFQDRIAEQLDLLSEAKRADLRAKRAFEKVVKLGRSLSEQDREMHRLKETEDKLYEDLLESEAEVAMEDMKLIPKFLSEEELQEFMTGTKLV